MLVEIIGVALIVIVVVSSLVVARVIGPIGEAVRSSAVILILGAGRSGKPENAH
jgi:hypothetical protein